MVELLAPAGSLDSLKAAVSAGADAVYIGGSRFGARAYADNPQQAQLIEGIEYCHLHGRKLYLTVNTLLKERELEEELYPYLLPYYESGADGLIVQDFGVARFVRRHFPGLPLHASTQMTVTGAAGASLLRREGFVRVVPARELSLDELRAIIRDSGVEVETFVHGAMCYAYSGQCLFSSLLGGRSGNRGRCAQPCRLPYRFGEAANGESYLLSMKDMCALALLPELIDAGIASFKIEGRMKRAEYTAGVVGIYRRCIDQYLERGREGYAVLEEDRRVLLDLYNRGGFSEGYYHTRNGKSMMALTRPNHQGTAAARIQSVRGPQIRAAALEPLYAGDVLETARDAEATLPADVPAGAEFTFRAGRSSLRPGQTVYRVKSEQLLRSIRARFLDAPSQEKICGELKISGEAPAMLRVWNGLSTCTVCDEIAQPARQNPTGADAVEKQLRRTGGTPFVFDRLQIALDEGLFVPVSRLNELRRRALAGLEEAILAAGRRKAPGGSDAADILHDTAAPDTQEATIPNTAAAPNATDTRQTTLQNIATIPVTTDRCRESVPDTEIASAAANVRQTMIQNTAAASGATDTRQATIQNTTAAPIAANTRQTTIPIAANTQSTIDTQSVQAAYRMNVLVTTWEQLDALPDAGACSGGLLPLDTVYLDSMFFGAENGSRRRAERMNAAVDAAKAKGFACFLSCPPVLRDRELAFFAEEPVRQVLRRMDGFLLHTIDELAFFARAGREDAVLAADDTLYAYNQRAAEFLRAHGAGRFTLPAELNSRELLRLDRSAAELIVYGHQPLMQSAQCPVKNTGGCTHTPSLHWLQDRRGIRFPVVSRCGVCCTTILNSVPLQLLPCREEIRRLHPAFVRLSFTVESGARTAQLLALFRRGLLSFAEEGAGPEGTRGHFKRGVE